MKPTADFNELPFIVIWEMTQACDLACVHCRASALPRRNPLELSTDEARRLIDEVAALQVPVFVLAGGDPLKRPDVFDLVEYASSHGVRISLTPSATPLLTEQAIGRLKRCGLARLAVSLDGPTAAIHDAFRRVAGSYDWTLQAVRAAHGVGLPVQINTTITRHNLDQLDVMISLLEQLDIVLWSVFFLVPTGRGSNIDLISAEEFEQVFEKLYETSRRVRFDIKSTEASTIAASSCSAGLKRNAEAKHLLQYSAPVAPTGSGARRVALMMARASCLFRISAKFFPAAFYRFPPVMYASNHWRTSTETRPCLSPCATQQT